MLKVEQPVLKKIAGAGIYGALQLKSTLSEIFHENTKLSPLSARAYTQSVAQLGKSAMVKLLMANPFKVYSLMDFAELEPAGEPNELEKIIAARRSVRSYSGEAVTQQELSRLLLNTYGRIGQKRNCRPVASGGALYPLEMYVVPLNVEGLERGWVYHYNADRHALDIVRREDRWEEFRHLVWLADMEDVEKISMVVVVTAIFARCTMKYQDRGYRLVLIEAGEVGHNLALLASSLGLGSCLLGGFLDDGLSKLLDIDGVDEAPLLPIVIGRPAATNIGGDGVEHAQGDAAAAGGNGAGSNGDGAAKGD
jgi:SagB-type dehydrogenase family enzyme